MTSPARPVNAGLAALVAAIGVTGCALFPEPTPLITPTAQPTASPEPTTSPTQSEAATSPSPTPEPPLSLDPPEATDPRQVRASAAVDVPPDGGGEIVVTVANLSDARIDEIVLRWPTALGTTLVLAPFVASEERIRDGGPPLLQDWTKWVEGPGERGEPAGTISLGYGPIDPATTLTVRIFVTRAAAGPTAFDLQLLAGEALLTREDGTPAELRVEVP